MEMLNDKNGKPSSKRKAGWLLLSLAIGMTVIGGLAWYDPNANLVEAMFYTGGGLLGLGTFETKK